MKKHNGFFSRLRRLGSMAARDAGLPVADAFSMEMADDGALRVKGCRGIAVYTGEEIVLLTDRFSLRVTGTGLFLRQYSETEAAVGGAVAAVSFGRDAL